MLNLMLNLLVGTLMISVTVVIHTFGLMSVTHVMNWVTGRVRIGGHRSRVIAMNSVVLGIFLVLTAEVWLWAACYDALRVVEDFPTALYFSTTTFATVGFGDVTADPHWRMLSALQGINGFLLIGWSTAYLVAAGIRVGPFRSGEHF